MSTSRLNFSSYFRVKKKVLDEQGFFNVSLIADLPLFIDPFHLFYSDKKEYQKLHDEMIRYLVFLKDLSVANGGKEPTKGQTDTYYRFPEVKQNWFGFTLLGNRGHGLGKEFAKQLNTNFHLLFSDFGVTTKPRHLEKLTLIADRAGKDTISDFTTNLIHGFLAKKTEAFAKKFIEKKRLKSFIVPRAEFDYAKSVWIPKTYMLPAYDGDYVLLTPRDLLTKNNTWINKEDFVKDFDTIPNAASNPALREQLVRYFNLKLQKYAEVRVNKKTKKEERKITNKTRKLAVWDTASAYPITVDIYIHRKEEKGDEAFEVSDNLVAETESVHEKQWAEFVKVIGVDNRLPTSYEEAHARALHFKKEIELHDLYKNLYIGDEPVDEDWIQRMFRLEWYGAASSLDRHPDNGLGKPDYKISQGSKDKALVEFKLASSSSLKQNLLNQLEKYKEIEGTDKGIWIVMVFNRREAQKVQALLKKHDLLGHPDYIVIDARKDNKVAPSKIGLKS